MDKLKELDKLHRDTEINFKIETFWDGPIGFYFMIKNDESGRFQYKILMSFETLEEGIDFLIKCYKEYKELD